MSPAWPSSFMEAIIEASEAPGSGAVGIPPKLPRLEADDSVYGELVPVSKCEATANTGQRMLPGRPQRSYVPGAVEP